jgi:small subunit ribosomal protein S1
MESTVMTDELSMDQILAQSAETTPGGLVEGTVVGVTDSHVLINVGLKQEAALPLKEFSNHAPEIGTVLTLLLIREQGPEGRPLVSWRQARERQNWDVVAQAQQSQQILEGRITQRIKGGFIVDIGLDAFMPASQLDDRQGGNLEAWVGQQIRVIVLEMDKAKGNVLVSRRRVVEQEKSVQRAGTLAALEVGQVYKGHVRALANFGAFIDIGGVEGLLHVSDLDWKRIDNPNKVLKVGEEIEVKVLKYDAASGRISLGRKQLMAHPWEGIEQRFPIGATIKGKVTGLADFGAFVELEPGVEGLIHVSEFSWTEKIKKPNTVLKAGQVVEAKLIGIDREKEKISLSLKRLETSPWEKILSQHPIGSKIEGEVTHMAPFGAFVRVAPGVEALLKTQDLSWTERIQNPSQVLKVGDKITTLVLEVNPKEERMALGLKQLTPDPIKSLKIGSTIEGVVSKIIDAGVFVKMESGAEGFIRANELVATDRPMFGERPDRDRKERAVVPADIKVGNPITATVIKIDKRDRKVDLSIRKYEKGQEKELLKKYSDDNNRPTLGDAIGWTD